MLINYHNVNIFQDDKTILNNVNFRVDNSEFIYVIGKVGSGKSSLLKTIYAELDVEADNEEATADVLGRNLFKLKRKEVPLLRREMGIIFQDFQLLHEFTVHGNLEFAIAIK